MKSFGLRHLRKKWQESKEPVIQKFSVCNFHKPDYTKHIQNGVFLNFQNTCVSLGDMYESRSIHLNSIYILVMIKIWPWQKNLNDNASLRKMLHLFISWYILLLFWHTFKTLLATSCYPYALPLSSN